MAKEASRETDTRAPHALLCRCAQGEDAAFETLYSTAKRKIFSAALLILRRRDLAEDVVPEAHLRAWTKASTYEPALGAPIVWMTPITPNLAIDVVRRPKRETQLDEGLLLAPPGGDPSALEEIEFSPHLTHARNALRNLDTVRRHLMSGAYLDSEGRKTLSERFAISVGAVKTWIRRGLLAARACLTSSHSLHRTFACQARSFEVSDQSSAIRISA